jgi:UDP-glucose 4-epimerase
VQAALGKRKLVNVYGTDYQTPDGSCVRDYIHVTDLVRASMAALKHLRNGYPSITCNIGNGHGFSVLEVIGAVKRVSGSDFDVRFSGRRAGDPAIIVASNNLALRKLDWLPLHTDLEEIIRHTFKWESHLNDLNPSKI